MEKIATKDFDFDHPVWKERPKHAQEFVAWLLNVDPDKRPDARRANRHRWLFRQSKLTNSVLSSDFDPTIRRFDDMLKEQTFQRKALNYLAFQCTIADIKHLREELYNNSSNRWGFVSSMEFKNTLANCGYPEDLMSKIFSNIEIDGGGFEFDDFLNNVAVASGRIVEIQLVQAFDAMDSKDISREDAKRALGEDYDDLHVGEIFENTTEHMSFPSFLHLFDRHLSELYGLTPSQGTSSQGTLQENARNHKKLSSKQANYAMRDPVMENYSGYAPHAA